MVDNPKGFYPHFDVTTYVERPRIPETNNDRDDWSGWDEIVTDAQTRLEQQKAHPLPGPRPEIIGRTMEEAWGAEERDVEATQRTILVAYTPAK